MKKISLILLLSVFVFSCKFSTKAEDGKDGNVGKSSKAITITNNDIKETVSYLASDELEGRNTGTNGIEKSAVFIEDKFKALGIKPYFESYRDNFKVNASTDSLDAFNVVAYIKGNDEKLKDEFILIGAHYDHIGFGKKVDNDSIANGANDNATGVAAVLATAKYFAARNSNKRSLIFALFSAEEIGLKGSNHLSKKLKDQNLNLYTVVNFEMLGVPFKDRNYEAFLTGYDKSNMAETINEYVNDTLIGFSEVSKKYSLFKRSDNYGFYQEFNVPSHTISSCDLTNFDYYHHVDDEVEVLNFDFTASFINKLLPAIEAMATSSEKEIKLNPTENND